MLDERTDAAVRRLWRRLEDDGVPTLLSHTHGRHLPHLSYALLRGAPALPAIGAVAAALAPVAGEPPLPLHLDALGTFRRSRCWLAPAVTSALAHRQERVVAAVARAGGEVHRHYQVGAWVPHVTLAPRLPLHQLPVVAAAVYAVLPLDATAVATVLVETGTGVVHPLAAR